MKKVLVLSTMMLFVGATVAPAFAGQTVVVNNDKGKKPSDKNKKSSENKSSCCQAKAASAQTCPVTGQTVQGDQKPCHAGKSEAAPKK